MKIVLTFAVFECFLFISFLQQLSSAAPTLQANDREDAVMISADVKRDAEYRNAQFSAYICHVQKAKELVTSKLNVSLKENMQLYTCIFNN